MGKYDGLVREIKSKFGSRLKKWDADIYADNLGIEMQDFSADTKLTNDILAFIKSKGYKIDYTSDDAFCEIKDSVKTKDEAMYEIKAVYDFDPDDQKDKKNTVNEIKRHISRFGLKVKKFNENDPRVVISECNLQNAIKYAKTFGCNWVKNEKDLLDLAPQEMITAKKLHDSMKTKDSQELKNLAYQFAKLGSELDRANSAQSRHLLEANDDKLYMELYKMGLKVKAQLEKEIPKMTNERDLAYSKKYASSFGSDILALLKDGLHHLYWGSDGVSRSLKSKGQELAKQIDDLVKKYSASARFGKDSLKKDSLKTYRINGKIIKAKNVDSAIRKYKDSLD